MSGLGQTFKRATGSGSLHGSDWLNIGLLAAAGTGGLGAAGIGPAAGLFGAGAGAAGGAAADVLGGVGAADAFAPGEAALSGAGAGMTGAGNLLADVGGASAFAPGEGALSGAGAGSNPTAFLKNPAFLKTAKGLLAGANVASKLNPPAPVMGMHNSSGFQPNNGFQLPSLSMPQANGGMGGLGGQQGIGGINMNDPQVQAILAQLARGGSGYG